MNIHGIRVVLGALLLELILFVVLVPIGFANTAIFLIAVPIGCFVFGYLVTKWVLRTLTSGWVLHGALVGIVATAMYFGLVMSSPGGLAAGVATYGAPLFYFCQVLRIAGCVAGGWHQQRRAALGLSPASRASV